MKLKIWLVFCNAMELLIYCVFDYYGCYSLIFGLIRLSVYILSFVGLNVYLKIKKIKKDFDFRMNMAVSTLLSSLMRTISVSYALIYLEKIREMVIIIIAYIISIIISFGMWKHGEVSDEKSKRRNGNVGKGLYIIGFLSVLGFVRIGSEDKVILFFQTVLLILIWLYLFVSLLFFVKCKCDFKNVCG